MSDEHVREALKEIETALPKTIWHRGEIEVKEATGSIPKDVRSFFGEVDGWKFMVVMWTDDSGTRADGTATKGGIIMRFSPKLAQLAGELAEKQALS